MTVPPTGVPTEEASVAVNNTGWPSVVVVVFAASDVVVSAAVMVTEEVDDVEAAFAESPL